MISWGTRRKLKYIFSIAFFALFMAIVIGFLIFYEKPSCTDGKQNRDEQGIDCGGSCSKVCVGSVSDVRTNWVRIFKIKDGVYSVAGYLENPNPNYQAENVLYKFKVYDSKGVLIAEPSGSTFIPAGQSFGVFEGWLPIGDRVPMRAVLEWQSTPVWKKIVKTEDPIVIKDVTREINDQGLPKISAVVKNESLKTINNVAGFVVVYDNFGNAIASSKTLVDQVSAGGSENMVFSWPQSFPGVMGRVEVLHWILPRSF